MDERDHVPPSWFELVLDTMLKTFPLDLHSGNDETVADEMTRIPDALAGPKAIQIGLFLFYVDSRHGIQPQPSGKCPSALVRPRLEWRQGQSLVVLIRLFSFLSGKGEKLLRTLPLGQLPGKKGRAKC